MPPDRVLKLKQTRKIEKMRKSKDYRRPECTVMEVQNEGLLNSISGSMGGFEDGGILSKENPFSFDEPDEEEIVPWGKNHHNNGGDE